MDVAYQIYFRIKTLARIHQHQLIKIPHRLQQKMRKPTANTISAFIILPTTLG